MTSPRRLAIEAGKRLREQIDRDAARRVASMLIARGYLDTAAIVADGFR